MSVANVAATAAKAVQKYGPDVVRNVNKALNTATGGKVKDVSSLASYVGSNPNRLKVAAEAMVQAGAKVDDILPDDLMGSDAALAEIRLGALSHVSNMRAHYEAASDNTLGKNDIAADVLRIARVRAALSVFGSEERYFLCIPNGGIPVEDFVFYREMRKAM